MPSEYHTHHGPAATAAEPETSWAVPAPPLPSTSRSLHTSHHYHSPQQSRASLHAVEQRRRPSTMEDSSQAHSFHPHLDYSHFPPSSAFDRTLPQPNGLPLPAMHSPTQPQSQHPAAPEHAWRDDARRKSMRLEGGGSLGVGGGGGGGGPPPSLWDYSGPSGTHAAAADARRASWAPSTSYGGAPLPLAGSHQQAPGAGGGPYGNYLPSMAAAPSSVPSHWTPQFPSQYAQTLPPTNEDPRPSSSSSASSVYPPPVLPLPIPQPTSYHPHHAYGSNAPDAYSPFTPASASFPSTIYQHPSLAHHALPPGGGIFNSPYSVTGSPHQHLANHDPSAYLPTPHTLYSMTPTVPPSATLASSSSGQPHPYHPSSPVAPTFPLDASTPYIPSSSPAVSSVVLTAASNRQKLGAIDLTGHSKPDTGSRRAVGTAPSTRRAVELVYDCQGCRRKIGTLTLRGGAVEKSTGNDASKYLGTFYCTNCAAMPPGSSSGGSGGLGSNLANAYAGEASYYDTLTAAVDAHLGIDTKAADVRPTPAAPGKTRSGFTSGGAVPAQAGTKKRRASVVETNDGVLGCDVCRRDLGTGTLQLASTGEPVGATVEVLCAHCETRYFRCSDCGGGGGQKGVGRWRCKEVFTNGRKTCMLSHTRLGTTNEMDYDVFPISTLSRTDTSEVVDHCRDLYYTTLLGTLAVPDMIESMCPIARSYAEVEKLCVDSWTTYEPFIATDIKSTANIRRYVALRWCRPSTRKKSKKKSSTDASPDLSKTSPNPQGLPLPPVASTSASKYTDSPVPTNMGQQPVIREGKTLTGFIVAEHDLSSGNLHIGNVVPTGAGESYDASTRLLQTLIARVHDDLAATNAHKAQMGMPMLPLVKMAWTMHMTKRDSRIMSRLETRRGFIPLEDYLVKYPDTNRLDFPPHRASYLPPEFLRGWTVYAKRLTMEDLPPSRQNSNDSSNGYQDAQQRPTSSSGGPCNGYTPLVDASGRRPSPR